MYDTYEVIPLKCCEIMDVLFALADEHDFTNTGDICIAGSPDKEASKVAVAMFATPTVIRQAAQWGADLLIVHEPVYNNATNGISTNRQDQEKKALIDATGMTVWRYHDHPHYTTPDIIAVGQLRRLGLSGKLECTDMFDLVRMELDTPISPIALATMIEERFHIQRVRICGVTDEPCTRVSFMFGAPGGGAIKEMDREQTEIVVAGEVAEWCTAQYAKDAAELGHKKSLLILGHIGSERDGMEYTADLLKEKAPQLEVKYFECGEAYTYTK